jgi:D-alanyl-D-alanine carboxypeptidase
VPSQLAASAPSSRGSAPSTLQQQADNLARGLAPIATPAAAQNPNAVARADAAPSFRLRGPETPATAPAGQPGIAGTFQIQVGAFSSPEEAERALTQTRERALDLLASYAPLTAPVQKEYRRLFRARFTGFDAKTAAATCLELRRRQIDCFVMRPE